MMRSMKGVLWADAAELAKRNQMQANRRPPFELGTLRSVYDFDGMARDAVEGRSGQLVFYRKRGSVRYS